MKLHNVVNFWYFLMCITRNAENDNIITSL